MVMSISWEASRESAPQRECQLRRLAHHEKLMLALLVNKKGTEEREQQLRQTQNSGPYSDPDTIGGDMSEVWRRLKSDPEKVILYLDSAAHRLDVMKRKSIDMLRLQTGSSVLDVGCGLGRDAEIISAVVGREGRVVGIDRDQDLVAKAIERTQALFP